MFDNIKTIMPDVIKYIVGFIVGVLLFTYKYVLRDGIYIKKIYKDIHISITKCIMLMKSNNNYSNTCNDAYMNAKINSLLLGNECINIIENILSINNVFNNNEPNQQYIILLDQYYKEFDDCIREKIESMNISISIYERFSYILRIIKGGLKCSMFE